MQNQHLKKCLIFFKYVGHSSFAAASAKVMNSVTRDRCYDYLKIFAEKFGDKIGIFDSKQS
jgi:hypothetical protein